MILVRERGSFRSTPADPDDESPRPKRHFRRTMSGACCRQVRRISPPESVTSSVSYASSDQNFTYVRITDRLRAAARYIFLGSDR